MKHFNVYSKDMKLVDKNVTSDYIKEEYDCKNPWRYAIKGMLLLGKFVVMEVEE